MSRPNTCASFDSNMEEENFRVNDKLLIEFNFWEQEEGGIWFFLNNQLFKFKFSNNLYFKLFIKIIMFQTNKKLYQRGGIIDNGVCPKKYT